MPKRWRWPTEEIVADSVYPPRFVGEVEPPVPKLRLRDRLRIIRWTFRLLRR